MYRRLVCIHLYFLPSLLLLSKFCLPMDLNEPPDSAVHIETLKRNYSNLMDLIIKDETVYTHQLYDEGWPHYNEDYELDVVDRSIPYRGTTAEKFRNGTVVEKSLGQVVFEAADVRGDSKEAAAWIRNVVESIGITALYRFCEITIAFATPKARRRIEELLPLATDFLGSLKRKFTELRLRTQPVDDLLSYANAVNVQPVMTIRMRRTYIHSCMVFMARYRLCTGLVALHRWQSIEGMGSIGLRTELMFTMLMINSRLRNMDHQQALIMYYNHQTYERPFTFTDDTQN